MRIDIVFVDNTFQYKEFIIFTRITVLQNVLFIYLKIYIVFITYLSKYMLSSKTIKQFDNLAYG